MPAVVGCEATVSGATVWLVGCKVVTESAKVVDAAIQNRMIAGITQNFMGYLVSIWFL